MILNLNGSSDNYEQIKTICNQKNYEYNRNFRKVFLNSKWGKN